MQVMLPSGMRATAQVSQSRQLDNIKICAGGKVRKIPLTDIDEILAGEEASNSPAFEGLETPLDELCVTLALKTDECITFRMPDIEQRDTMTTSFSGSTTSTDA